MSTLKVHLTYACTAQCMHCRFGCVREPGPAIDYNVVMECVAALQRLNQLEMVVLMGGEPGLFPELTQRLTAAIRARNIAVRIETNASWAVDEKSARQFLEPLCAEGASLMFSLDVWHEPFVPLERVVRAARVSDALGAKYNLEMAYLDFPSRRYDLDKRTDAMLTEFECQLGKRVKVYQGTILYNGRAAERLAGLVAPGRGIPAVVCDQVPWWRNGHLKTLELLELDPDGYLSKGCGIAIGNVKQIAIANILATYDATQHPIFATLQTLGPLGLAREAEAFGYVLKTDYADKCHLCQEARQFLLSKYPLYLVPEQHYKKELLR